jgi:hypothetical protein
LTRGYITERLFSLVVSLMANILRYTDPWVTQYIQYTVNQSINQSTRQAFLFLCCSQMVHSPNGSIAKWYIRQMAHSPNGTHPKQTESESEGFSKSEIFGLGLGLRHPKSSGVYSPSRSSPIRPLDGPRDGPMKSL